MSISHTKISSFIPKLPVFHFQFTLELDLSNSENLLYLAAPDETAMYAGLKALGK